MAMRVDRTIMIERPIDEVFNYVSNSANNPKWQPEIIEHEQLSVGPLGVGTQLHHVSKFMGKRIDILGVVTDFVQNHKIDFTVKSGTLPYKISYLTEPADGGTRFTYSSVAELNGLLKLAQPLMMIFAKRTIDADLRRLKAQLENVQSTQ